MAPPKRHVIIGNGVAGVSAAAEIRKTDPSAEILLLGAESHHFYSRIRLIDLLSGETDIPDLLIRKPGWYEDQRIEVILNCRVTAVDPAGSTVTTADGRSFPYDSLLLATGGISFIPPIPGSSKKGVYTLRTIEDALAIREYAKGSRGRVLLIGGGVLGLEAGNALRKAGCRITVVEFFPRLLPRQTDPHGALILQRRFEKMGFSFFLGRSVREINGTERTTGVVLDDGRTIDCDVIVISAGIRPDALLAQSLSLPMDKGILVNDRMETAMNHIYAAGDVVQHRGILYGLWHAAESQGTVAGSAMAGGDKTYEGTVPSNRLKVAGIDLMAAGDIDPDGSKESVVYTNEEEGVYRKLVFQNNVIIGALLCGDLKDSRKIMGAIESKRDVKDIRTALQQWNLESL